MSAIDPGIRNYLSNKDNISPHLPENCVITEFKAFGGQGVVYQGLLNGSTVAIKIYYPGQHHVRVEREVQTLLSISNDCIVKLHWSGSIPILGTLPVVVTEWVEGILLTELIFHNPLPVEILKQLCLDMSGAIECLWNNLTVHRDIKPSNIIFRADNRFCLIDLGVARHINLTTLTIPGGVVGTNGYLSPEQTMANRQLTCKSDIYSLGIVLLEAAIGFHPTGFNQVQLLNSNYHKNLPFSLPDHPVYDIIKWSLNPAPYYRPSPFQINSFFASH